jgi:NAD(P)-dependent dehydrogenase (short-subunit alcohol dehydrogenase family)
VFCRLVDVSDATQLQILAKEVFEQFGHINLLFNNAGMVVNVNLMGVVNGLLAFVPHMIEQGSHAHIVNTGSVATKMAVRGITETLQQELAEQGANIGVSTLCPGPVDTPILASSGLVADNLENGPVDDAGKTEAPDTVAPCSPFRVKKQWSIGCNINHLHRAVDR